MFSQYMELAIPLIALGGLYLISNQKEGFVDSIGTGNIEQTDWSIMAGPDKWAPPIPTPADHFYKVTANGSSPTYTDLAGRTVNILQSTGNMVPTFGKDKTLGNLPHRDQAESTLDTYTGSASLQIAKSEVAPMFKPQDNIQWANGSPDSSDFYQSRVNPALRMNNVKPFEQTYVGPGMNQGYTNQGSGGFNSGMEARPTWMPKTVDQLRPLINPKASSFGLQNHEGPAHTLVKNLGIEGKMEKHLPDKFYINTGTDRMLTTTGIEIASTLRAIQPDPTIHRATTTQAYSGVAGNSGVESQPKHGMYRIDHRQQLKAEGFTPAGRSVDQNNLTQVKNNYRLEPTNRSVNSYDAFGGVQGLVSALTAPFTDILRPTRKEVFGINRIGNAGSTVSNSPGTVIAPAKTIRDSTAYSPYAMGQRPYNPTTDGGYQVSAQQPIENQRDTTNISYMGIGGSVMPKQVSYASNYNATISSNRSNEDRTPGGNLPTFQPYINQTNTSTKSDMHTGYMGNASSVISVPPTDHSEAGRIPQQYAEPNRYESDMVSEFKKNPYTQSLHSVA